MTIEYFDVSHKYLFFELCKAFYESEASLRGYDQSIAETTFARILDRHENLWGVMLLDEETREPFGYALITSYWCNEEGGNVIVLDELYINPNKRKNGYAKMFMQWLEAEYSENAVSITLEVLTTNQKACELYIKSGYAPDGFTTYTKSLKKPCNSLT